MPARATTAAFLPYPLVANAPSSCCRDAKYLRPFSTAGFAGAINSARFAPADSVEGTATSVRDDGLASPLFSGDSCATSVDAINTLAAIPEMRHRVRQGITIMFIVPNPEADRQAVRWHAQASQLSNCTVGRVFESHRVFEGTRWVART